MSLAREAKAEKTLDSCFASGGGETELEKYSKPPEAQALADRLAAAERRPRLFQASRPWSRAS